ncbi:MAG TPA: hypothetical protein VEJ38_07035 [Candidatus Acidoferrales bacterium]|nr:hypothetical protein [Candidatus Acidoferrales bacterium]
MKLTSKFARIGRIVLATALLSISGVAYAQDNPPAPPPGPPPGHHHRFAGAPMSDEMMGFVGFEAGLGGKVVTGAPFSATFTSKTTQVLADGNQINRTSTGTIARDSEGRTRRDMTLPAIGRFAASGQSTPPHAVFINDAVAKTQYVLQPDQKIARSTSRSRWNGEGRTRPEGDAMTPKNRPGVVTTSLGMQTISGVLAEGTRTTRTIAAGAVGNEKPIVMTTERWYSSELHTYVMIKRSDPYVGESEFELTNIQRSEPDATLFQVPADYTVRAMGRAGRFGGPMAHPHGGGMAAPPPPQD